MNGIVVKCVGFGGGSRIQDVTYYIGAMCFLCACWCGTLAPKTNSRGPNFPQAHPCSGDLTGRLETEFEKQFE